MECPRCTGKLKRTRTVNAAKQVIRYNRCLECGERIKTIELYVYDFESQMSGARLRAIKAEMKAEQLSFNLEAIQTAFKTIGETLSPRTDRRLEQALTAPIPRRRGF